MPDPPVNVDSKDTSVPIGQTWINTPITPGNSEQPRINGLKAWWSGLILNQDFSLREKMTLFWHNHFSTETDVARDSRFLYQHHSLIRKNCLGNFKQLVKDMTIDGTMLFYLSGSTNTVGAPNENYGREVLELFTVGKGPLIAPGDYTTYTENDVKAAAQVCTGWSINRGTNKVTFTAKNHDTSTKTFSSAFGNKQIKNNNEKEYLDLIDLIFDQVETSKYICRKLYRWFVYYNIDASVETNMIIPMAKILRDNNFEIKPVLKALFSSAHFYDDQLNGSQVKNPIDFINSIFKSFEVKFPSPTPIPATLVVDTYYALYNYYAVFGIGLDLNLGDPPNVAGWGAYYQIPSFYHIWLSAVTMTNRIKITDAMSTVGVKRQNFLSFVSKFAKPEEASGVIDEASEFILPAPITQIQKEFLLNAFMGGLPADAWAMEWDNHIKNPNDANTILGLNSKLSNLFRAMLSMAEFQLC
ncbi:MAG: DUF1800 domain-containing protein [Candidatus Kapabacteria bacterium]|nr:DUF1800 domain-containing protein [Candidatus Kapabacteria bacterium]